jgi:hypothetical protein
MIARNRESRQKPGLSFALRASQVGCAAHNCPPLAIVGFGRVERSVFSIHYSLPEATAMDSVGYRQADGGKLRERASLSDVTTWAIDIRLIEDLRLVHSENIAIRILDIKIKPSPRSFFERPEHLPTTPCQLAEQAADVRHGNVRIQMFTLFPVLPVRDKLRGT